jgi:hypothetical protein
MGSLHTTPGSLLWMHADDTNVLMPERLASGPGLSGIAIIRKHHRSPARRESLAASYLSDTIVERSPRGFVADVRGQGGRGGQCDEREGSDAAHGIWAKWHGYRRARNGHRWRGGQASRQADPLGVRQPCRWPRRTDRHPPHGLIDRRSRRALQSALSRHGCRKRGRALSTGPGRGRIT